MFFFFFSIPVFSYTGFSFHFTGESKSNWISHVW
jgi:hypothetical protein